MEYWYQYPTIDTGKGPDSILYKYVVNKTYWLKYQQINCHYRLIISGSALSCPLKKERKKILYCQTFNTKCVIFLICSQMKFEAKRKVEEEKRKRELVKWRSQICSPLLNKCFTRFIKEISFLKKMYINISCFRSWESERWWMSHTWWSLQSWAHCCRQQEVRGCPSFTSLFVTRCPSI